MSGLSELLGVPGVMVARRAPSTAEKVLELWVEGSGLVGLCRFSELYLMGCGSITSVDVRWDERKRYPTLSARLEDEWEQCVAAVGAGLERWRPGWTLTTWSTPSTRVARWTLVQPWGEASVMQLRPLDLLEGTPSSSAMLEVSGFRHTAGSVGHSAPTPVIVHSLVQGLECLAEHEGVSFEVADA